MRDQWKTGVNSSGPRHPEWDASPETKAKSCGPGMQPFERSKNPIQVNLFGEWKTNGGQVKEIMRPTRPRVGAKWKTNERQMGDK